MLLFQSGKVFNILNQLRATRGAGTHEACFSSVWTKKYWILIQLKIIQIGNTGTRQLNLSFYFNVHRVGLCLKVHFCQYTFRRHLGTVTTQAKKYIHTSQDSKSMCKHHTFRLWLHCTPSPVLWRVENRTDTEDISFYTDSDY